MKFLTSELLYFFQGQSAKRNVGILLKFILVLIALVFLYSYIFLRIMALEGREFSWIAGVYWTLVTMTTLGLGDITFNSEIGRLFSVFVLGSGVIVLLIMLPFTFIQFFYAPWLEAQNKARTPRRLREDTRGHVIIMNLDAVGAALVDKLKRHRYPYAILVGDQQKAVELYDQGYRVVLGDSDDIRTYQKIRADQAALLFCNRDDQLNTNAIFTLRELSDQTPIVASADNEASVDIMELAGANYVFLLSRMLGNSLARRVLGASTRSNIIGGFDQLAIAEAPVMRTPLEGKSLRETAIRENTGVNVVGLWQRGSFKLAGPDTQFDPHTVLVLAGSEVQLRHYDELYGVYTASREPVLILGGGRVGRAAAEALRARNVDYRIVDEDPTVARDEEGIVVGNAADLEVLKQAGIERAPSVIISTNSDDMNIYLAIYCRRLRPDIQIISRATLDRNISQLHLAGTDLVISYASMGANAVLNFLKGNRELMVAEGLNILRHPIPGSLINKALKQSRIREKTGCSVIAVRTGSETYINPEPEFILEEDQELIVIGTKQAEKKFLKNFEQNTSR
jgi:Trk K+ transport system NAD-binding subunit